MSRGSCKLPRLVRFLPGLLFPKGVLCLKHTTSVSSSGVDRTVHERRDDQAVGGRAAPLDGAAKPPFSIYTSIVSPTAVSSHSNRVSEKLKGEPSGLALRYLRQVAARELLPGERVSFCLRCRVSVLDGVKQVHDADARRCFFRGLLRCGSVWLCPLCQFPIHRYRQYELSEGVARWGGQVLLVTQTLRHRASEPLARVLAGLLDAARSMRMGKRWLAFCASERRAGGFGGHGVFGTVRSLEVTHGAFGWHPHLHSLYFVKPGVDVERLRAELGAELWQPSLRKHGRFAHDKYGLDVRHTTAEVADYVSKWGKPPKWNIAAEMALSSSKNARGTGVSPHELLDRYAAGDKCSGELYVEYARAFKGRCQLVWSPGLRDVLLSHLPEQSDEVVATREGEGFPTLYEFSRLEWYSVLYFEGRARVLYEGRDGSVDAVRSYVSGLVAELEKRAVPADELPLGCDSSRWLYFREAPNIGEKLGYLPEHNLFVLGRCGALGADDGA